MRPNSMPTKDAHEREIDAATTKAEKAIQRILIDLANETGMCVELVEVDTRNYGCCRTAIFLK